MRLAMLSRFGLALLAWCAVALPACADLAVKDGNAAAQTIFDFTCFSTKHCTAHVNTNSAGTEIFTSGNAGYVQFPTAQAVTQSGTWNVSTSQSGTWTVQPGNTPNTSAWLMAPPTATTTMSTQTIAVTNTYIQALASNSSRKGCTIQYIPVAGSTGYVFLGSVPGGITTSFQLTARQSFSCQSHSVTASDAVQVTGTATDIFIVSAQ